MSATARKPFNKESAKNKSPAGKIPKLPDIKIPSNNNNAKEAKKEPQPEEPVFDGHIESAEERIKRFKGKTFVFTSAQNNTLVHEGFMDTLESYCKHRGAQLYISQFTYNKASYGKKSVKPGRGPTSSDYAALDYDDRVKPYILNDNKQVAKGLVFRGELNILPTADNPFARLGNYCQDKSGIIPHARVEMRSLPDTKDVRESMGPRFLYTTGTCTQRNYIQKLTGQIAEHHHTYGALVVEVDNDGDFFVRQLIADEKTGAFYDLDKLYLPNGKVLTGQRPEAIEWGDVHVEESDPVVLKAAFGKAGMLDRLHPYKQFMNDLLSFSARGHHNIDDPDHRSDHFFNDGRSVEKGFSLSGEFLKAAQRKDTETIVKDSNHDFHYRRWLKRPDKVEFDPQNKAFFYRSKTKLEDEVQAGNSKFNLFEWAVRSKAPDLANTVFLPEDKDYPICTKPDGTGGIECSLHGHLGVDGSKGSPKAFTAISRKANTGHTHVANIVQGVWTAGVTGSLKQGYNKGISKWSHSHILTYANGKRAMITMKDGKWKR